MMVEDLAAEFSILAAQIKIDILMLDRVLERVIDFQMAPGASRAGDEW